MVPFNASIVNFVFSLGLTFSKPQMNHLLNFMQGLILTDGRMTVSQIRRSTHEARDLSCMTRFLNESPWCPNRRRRLELMRSKIKRARAKQGDTRPIAFLIVDDSQCKKDRSTSRMEGLDHHFSHSDRNGLVPLCRYSPFGQRRALFCLGFPLLLSSTLL